MNLRTLPLAILLPLALPGVLPAAEQPLIDPQSEYARAVKSYVDAANDQLRAIRQTVDAQLKTAPEETKMRFKKAYDGMDESNRLLTQLKNAAPADFDRVKAEFERTLAKTLKELETAQKG